MADNNVTFFCESCQGFRSVVIEDVRVDDLNAEPWGDILCGTCSFVIATITCDEPGRYRLVKETAE